MESLTDDKVPEHWDWTGPRGFQFWSVLTMVGVGVASMVFINLGVPWGVRLPGDARAGYWATAIGAGVALAGSLVAIVLARRAHEVSVNLYRLEQRVERRQLNNSYSVRPVRSRTCVMSRYMIVVRKG